MRNHYSISLLGIWLATFSSTAQIDSNYQRTLEDVVVTSYLEESDQASSLNIQAINVNDLKTAGNFSVAEMLSDEPGMDMMSTGSGITKPVLRGAYGSRLLILLSGLKFDNQQWQDEHGLGLPTMGLDHIEVVRGPLSVLYGSEAIGGLINTIEESRAPVGQTLQDVRFSANSNTLGGMLEYGYRRNRSRDWYRIRIGVENHGDYSDGQGNRVLNSRFDGYYLKGTYGFTRGNWTSNNHFMSTANRFGFIFTGAYDFIEEDSRWSRNLSYNPTHLVFLNTLTSENEIVLENGNRLDFKIGMQSNERMENEGSGAISLNMHLFTAQILAKYQLELNERNHLTLSNLTSFENNINFGARKIVPNANLFELNFSAYIKSDLDVHWGFENGLNIGGKQIATSRTPTVNTDGKELTPFTVQKPYWNWMSGLVYRDYRHWTFKINAGTGVRVANLAELSSDGLHEGIYTYEIGNPDLENETSISLNGEIKYQNRNWELMVTPFYSRYFNFIYLAPTSEDWFGFPVYRYQQMNSAKYGTEVGVRYSTEHHSFRISYESVIHKLDDGSFVPFLPAQKIKPSMILNFFRDKIPLNLIVDGVYCFDQNRIAFNESSTSGYWLLNLGIQFTFNQTDQLTFKLDNVFDAYYVSHLSRLKDYGVYNMGRNFNVSYTHRF